MPAFLALVAAIGFELAATWQQHVKCTLARRASAVAGLAGLFRLVLVSIWLLGTLILFVGYATQGAALDRGMLVVVQPLMVTTIVPALPLGYWLTSQHVGVGRFSRRRGRRGRADDVRAGRRPKRRRRRRRDAGPGVSGCGDQCRGRGAPAVAATKPPASLRAAVVGLCAGLWFGLSAAFAKPVINDLRGHRRGGWRLADLGLLGFGFAHAILIKQLSLATGPLAPAMAAVSVSESGYQRDAWDSPVRGATESPGMACRCRSRSATRRAGRRRAHYAGQPRDADARSGGPGRTLAPTRRWLDLRNLRPRAGEHGAPDESRGPLRDAVARVATAPSVRLRRRGFDIHDANGVVVVLPFYGIHVNSGSDREKRRRHRRRGRRALFGCGVLSGLIGRRSDWAMLPRVGLNARWTGASRFAWRPLRARSRISPALLSDRAECHRRPQPTGTRRLAGRCDIRRSLVCVATRRLGDLHRETRRGAGRNRIGAPVERTALAGPSLGHLIHRRRCTRYPGCAVCLRSAHQLGITSLNRSWSSIAPRYGSVAADHDKRSVLATPRTEPRGVRARSRAVRYQAAHSPGRP